MKERNNIVDIIRGFAMLLVVLGHTISGCTTEFQGSFLFQMIWTLQMPLFIIISGYVTRYSSPLTDRAGGWAFIKKRTLAYLLPWAVWIFVIRAAIFGQTEFFDPKFILWHTDSGYWFLLTIWTISLVFGIADLLSNKIAKKKSMNILLHIAFCGAGMVLLAFIGYVLDMSFLGIKFTLYYLPFYLLGYLYGQIQDTLMTKSYTKTIANVITAICLGFWLAIINRYDFYGGADTLMMIIFRYCTSIAGCIAIIGIFVNMRNGTSSFAALGESKSANFLKWIGVHSLEIYMIHGFSLCLLRLPDAPAMYTWESWCLITVNFVITVILSIVFIRIIESNKLLNKILFWK